jgi:glutathione S-transferase
MKLYAFIVAPNPTRVRLYLAEKTALGGTIAVEEVMVNLREGEQKLPEHLARNPFGKVPVLELDDGSLLLESLAIIQYLEEIHPEPAMIGRVPVERARVRALERIAEIGVLMPIARIVHATKSPLGLPPNPGVAEQARDSLPDALGFLDRVLADGREFVAGARPTIADCTLAAALQFGRFGEVEIDRAFEHVLRWDRAYRGRAPAQTVLVL